MNTNVMKLIAAFFAMLAMANAANIAEVPKTGPGNTDTSGAGQQWPTTRFIVTGDCVTDVLTGLIWPKNGIIGFEATNGGTLLDQPDYNNTTANLNTLVYASAKSAITKLNNATNKLCGSATWRLPNVNELRSLLNYQYADGYTPAAWLNSQGFIQIKESYYWTINQRYDSAGITNEVYSVNFDIGGVLLRDTANADIAYVLPVRGGR